jgi:preprotein translocase subunit SecG
MLIGVVVVHVAVSFLLGILVLLHNGQGAGLSDMFGGMSSAASGSSVMEKNLDRLTVLCAIVFSFTTILLGLLLTSR